MPEGQSTLHMLPADGSSRRPLEFEPCGTKSNGKTGDEAAPQCADKEADQQLESLLHPPLMPLFFQDSINGLGKEDEEERRFHGGEIQSQHAVHRFSSVMVSQW